jgi:hypothetical protein
LVSVLPQTRIYGHWSSGQFIDDLSGVYFRLYGFPPAGFKFKLEPIRVTVDGKYYDETDTVLRNLYDLKSPQAVSNQSLRTALYDTGELIETGKSNGAGKASDMAPILLMRHIRFLLKQYGGTVSAVICHIDDRRLLDFTG